VIGLRAWLASIKVPDTSPECECGWRTQTIEHIFNFCPKYDRAVLGREEGGQRGIKGLLETKEGCRTAAQWFLGNKVLPYLTKSHEGVTENRTGFGPAPELTETSH